MIAIWLCSYCIYILLFVISLQVCAYFYLPLGPTRNHCDSTVTQIPELFCGIDWCPAYFMYICLLLNIPFLVLAQLLSPFVSSSSSSNLSVDCTHATSAHLIWILLCMWSWLHTSTTLDPSQNWLLHINRDCTASVWERSKVQAQTSCKVKAHREHGRQCIQLSPPLHECS